MSWDIHYTRACYVVHSEHVLGFCGDLYSVPRVSDTYARGPLFFHVLPEV